MSDARRDVDDQVDGEGSGRREFLKKAGKIAFVVPAIQVLSMAPAGAQSNGSVVTTSMPPGSTMPPTSTTSTTSSTTTSSTTSSTTTTTEAPCNEVRYRIKGIFAGGEVTWTTGVDSGDCLTDPSNWDSEALGNVVEVTVNPTISGPGVASLVRIQAPEGCWFDIVAGKLLSPSSSLCRTNESGADFVVLAAGANGGITQVEAILVCCA